jgi:hypothetical protein
MLVTMIAKPAKLAQASQLSWKNRFSIAAFHGQDPTSMKGPSLSRRTSTERAWTAYEPSVCARSLEVCRVVRSTTTCAGT